jgi:hypothetical protein
LLQFKFSSEVKSDQIVFYFRLDLLEETEKRTKKNTAAIGPSLSSRSTPPRDLCQAHRKHTTDVVDLLTIVAPQANARACASLVTSRLDRWILPRARPQMVFSLQRGLAH